MDRASPARIAGILGGCSRTYAADAAYFLAPVGVYVYYDDLSPVIVEVLGSGSGWRALGLGRLQEAAELLLALGFLRFLLRSATRLRRSGVQPAPLG